MNEGMRRYLDSLPEGSVKHFTVENCPALAEYDRQMREETIPAIERAMKASRRAAHFACLGIPDPLASEACHTISAATCIEIARQVRDGFLSEEYATNQPLSSLNERFACDQVIEAIEAAIRIEAGTGGTPKSGPTRSARAGAEGIARNTP